MSIKFKLSPKINTFKNPPETKYYPRVVHKDTIDFDRIASIISHRGTVTRSDCYAVLIALNDLIAENVADGNLVKIGELGSFQISLKGEGKENPDEKGKNLIHSAKLVFRPGKLIKKTLKSAKYERIK